MHESRDIDIFVATYGLMKKEGSPARSYTVWGEGIDTLLPVADLVAFAYRDGETAKHALLPWSEAMERFGALMEQTDFEPARYRVRRHPDRAVLEGLAAAAPEQPRSIQGRAPARGNIAG
jgi:hypothetical protein